MSLERLVLNVSRGGGISEGRAGHRVILAHVQVLQGRCFYVWLGEALGGASMNNMALSLQTRYDEMPLTRVLIPAAHKECAEELFADEYATALSARLAKRLQMQVFVSLNMKVDGGDDDELLKSLEQALSAYITSKSQP